MQTFIDCPFLSYFIFYLCHATKHMQAPMPPIYFVITAMALSSFDASVSLVKLLCTDNSSGAVDDADGRQPTLPQHTSEPKTHRSLDTMEIANTSCDARVIFLAVAISPN
jgi:hypothetical protein